HRLLAAPPNDAAGGCPVSARRVLATDPRRTTTPEPLAGLDPGPPRQAQGEAMRFWIHEIAGWLLLGLGLLVFYLCFAMLVNLQILEAGPMTVIGIILFRGG